MDRIKRNLPLILGLSIPVLMIVGVAASIYLPQLFAQPQYDFLYASGGGPFPPFLYSVENGRLTRRENPAPRPEPAYYYRDQREPELFMHNVGENVSRSISFEDASKLQLDLASVSPDGYSIRTGSGPDNAFEFIFGGRNDYNARYLVQGNAAIRLNLIQNRHYYDEYAFQFLGWVVP